MDNTELLKTVSNAEFNLVPFENEDKEKHMLGLSISDIAGYGSGLAGFAGVINNALQGTNGLYRVTMPEGTHLAEFKNGKGYLGALLNNSDNQLAGQAVLNQAFDPVALANAGAMVAIYAKLGQIEAAQKEMMNFIEEKEKSEQRGDLIYLIDTYNNIKLNFDNEKFKNIAHMKAADIKQASVHKVELYKSLISHKIKNASLLLSDIQIKKLMNDIKDYFYEYSLALYLYSFSTCIEVLMQGNFSKEYLNTVAERINKYSIGYRETYTKAFNFIESATDKSLETLALKGAKGLSTGLGKLADKIPVVKKTKAKDTLDDLADTIKIEAVKKNKGIVGQLVDKQEANIKPFVSIIDNINNLYNKDAELVVDSENIYLVENKTA